MNNDEIVFNQCKLVLQNAEQLVIDQDKLINALDRRISELEAKYENLAQQVRARDAI